MNGATTDPCESINNPPSNNNTMIIGSNQSFLRIRRKDNNSVKNSICFKGDSLNP